MICGVAQAGDAEKAEEILLAMIKSYGMKPLASSSTAVVDAWLSLKYQTFLS